jgi:hypothetical protein
MQDLLVAYDENGDGIIDYTERGKGGWRCYGLGGVWGSENLGREDTLRLTFLFNAIPLRLLRKDWNPAGEDSGKHNDVNRAVGLALAMSKQPTESPDPFFPGMTWGNGKWPSIQYIRYRQNCTVIYGAQNLKAIGLNSLYGLAFQYATLTSSRTFPASDQGLADYLAAVAGGAVLLSFRLYVPRGYGTISGRAVPNVMETDDPSLIFTASFEDDHEKWQELSL